MQRSLLQAVIDGIQAEVLPNICHQISLKTATQFPHLAHQASNSSVVQLLMSACRQLLRRSERAELRALELGCFAGFATAALASVVGQTNGRIVCVDSNAEHIDFTRENLSMDSSLSRCVELHHSDALPWLSELSNEPANLQPPFDVVYIDANKRAYSRYFDLLFEKQLLRSPGLVVCDNMLFKGFVVNPTLQPPKKHVKIVESIRSFRTKLAEDERVETAFLSMSDGVSVSVFPR